MFENFHFLLTFCGITAGTLRNSANEAAGIKMFLRIYYVRRLKRFIMFLDFQLNVELFFGRQRFNILFL